MGSVGSSNPNAALKDCSQGICSIYCPQWCYIVYSPPPPSSILLNDDDDSDSAFQFSPLVVAVIGILASTFILVTYYSIISRFCRNRSSTDQNDDENVDLAQVSSSASNSGGGLDEALIKSITVCKYTKGGGLVEGIDCSVCLSAFEENESLRLLPKCNHAFHLPCIDPWLRSHSSCPLCRSSVEASVTSVSNVNALEYQQRSRDVVVIVQSSQQHVIVGFCAQVAPVPAKLSEEEGESVERILNRRLNESAEADLELQREEEGESVEQILNRRLNESAEADLELQQREVVSDIGNRSASVERIDLCSRDGKGSNSETC